MNSKKIVLLSLFIAIISLAFINYTYNKREKLIEIKTKETNDKKIYALIKNIEHEANLIRDLIATAENKTLLEIRSKVTLESQMKHIFDNVKHTGFKNIDLHLPNNTQFIKLDETNDEEDEIEQSVIHVNKIRNSIVTFELEHSIPKLKFVYPIWKGSNYLGILEICYEIDYFIERFKTLYEFNIDFIATKLKDNSSNYIVNTQNKDYQLLISTFHKVSSFDNKTLGHFEIKKESKILTHLRNEFYLFIFITIFLILAVMIYIIFQKNYSLKLEEKVNKKTGEIKKQLTKINKLNSELIENENNLNIHKAELESQNEELIEKEKSLQNSFKEYEVFFNEVPNPYFIINEHLDITAMNKEAITKFDINKRDHNSLINYLSKDSIITLMDNITYLRDGHFNSKSENFSIIDKNEVKNFKGSLVVHPNKKYEFILTLVDIQNEINLMMKLKYFNNSLEEKVKEELAKSLKKEQIITTVINTLPLAVYIKNANLEYSYCNETFLNIVGKNKDEVIGKNVWSITDKKFAKIYNASDLKLIENKSQIYDTEVVFADGTKHDVTFFKSTFDNEDGSLGGLIGFMVDNTEKISLINKIKELNQSLEIKVLERTEQLRNIIDEQDSMILLIGDNNIEYANKQFLLFFDCISLEEFYNKFNSICDIFEDENNCFYCKNLPFETDFVKELNNKDFHTHTVGIKDKNGYLQYFSIRLNSFNSSNHIVSFTNISKSFKRQQILESKLIRDKLTGAYNREYFESNINSIILDCKKNNYLFGIALLDIDHFKRVNDLFGHNIGDNVLIEFVRRIKKYSRSDDILIRWGGEEFVLLVKLINKDALTSVLEHIRKVIEMEDFEVAGKITCSIGATIYKYNEEISASIKRSDISLYNAKSEGRNRVMIS